MCKKNEYSVRKEGSDRIDARVCELLVGSPLKPKLRAAARKDLQQMHTRGKVLSERHFDREFVSRFEVKAECPDHEI